MKTPKPWFREQTKTWYVQLGGVQHNLGKDKKEADKAFHRLMAGEGLSRPMKDLPFAGLVEQFLADSANDVTPETGAWYRRFLEDFSDRYAKIMPADIAPRHVRAWVNAERKKKWGQSTQRSAITILKRLLNWAAQNRLVGRQPDQGLREARRHRPGSGADGGGTRPDPGVVSRG